ncbi:MAG: NUDIX domain-containing protein [Candidatus Aenigmatarchaeota archaeon]|nr:NUDIX domain-containing protein [Candidatus Aenigmarchaeota archaeon]
MIKEQVVGVLAVIKKGKKFLFVKRSNKLRFEPSKWGFIGETMKYEESFEDTLKRGLKEEVRMKLTSFNLMNVYSFNFKSQYNDKHRHAIVIAFLCSAKGKIKLNNELEDYIWLEIDEAKKLDLINSNKQIIKDIKKWCKLNGKKI